MRLGNAAVAALALGALVSSAVAQEEKEDKKGGMYLGVKGGLYFPTDSEIKDIFGSSIFVVGLSFDDFSRQADKWRLTWDVDFISGRDGDDKFFAMPVTASIGRVFGSPDDKFRPYVRFGAGLAYFDYSITRPSTGQRFSEKRIGFGGDVELGAFVSDRVRVSAKYVLFSEVDKFNFSGLQLTATINLFKF